MAEFVQIAAYRDVMLAKLAVSKLESEGISAHILNEHIVTQNWSYSQAVGGVQVMVPRDQAEKAKEILDQDHSEIMEDLDPAIVCEKCGSDDVAIMNNRRRFAISALLLFPVFLWRKKYTCRSCGHSWR
jgi:DNA-directed RNA polymerase subunit M/transcription elongation factor TFIIS